MCYAHDDTEMTRLDGETSRVDLELVPLVGLLNERGIEVLWSCQGAAKMIDQTDPDGKRFRSVIRMKRSDESFNFVRDLIDNFYAFRTDKTAWTIDFDWSKDDIRIVVAFPHMDIEKLVEYLEMEKERENFVQSVSDALDFGEKEAIESVLKERND